MKDNCFIQDREEAVLIARIQRGDMDAFTSLYNKYYPYLFTLTMRYVKNKQDSEDILQQVFLKIWQIRSSLQPGSNIKGFLFTITRNLVVNHIRDKNVQTQRNYSFAQNMESAENDLLMKAEDMEMVGEMISAIDNLPPQQKKVVFMRCEGLSNREIADRLSLSLNTVNTHYSKGLKKLKAALRIFMGLLLLITTSLTQ